MIAGILRGVLLRFASEYLSNIDINKLSLWSGHVSLHNVNLNASAITNSLNLPFLRLESGKVSSLDVSIPWTSLSTKKVIVNLSNVEVDLSLTDNLINLNKPPAVSESEETLLSKILANMTIIIQDLTVRIKMNEEASYIGCLSIREIQVQTTNPLWQEEFTNPFLQLPNGISFKIYRLIEVEGLSLRVISGKKEDVLSDIIVSHKFEPNKCGGCPLCFGFKESSFYTLFNITNVAFKVFWLSSTEQTTAFGKSGLVEFMRAKTVSEIFLQIMSNINAKCNLVYDQMLVRDLWTALDKFEVPEIHHIEVQDNGWLSWGKSMLTSPLSCSPALGHSRIKDKINSKELKFSSSLPSFMIKLRVHNLQELKALKYVFSGENASIDSSINSSESSEGTTLRVYENKANGSIRNFMMTCYEKQNCSIFSITLLSFVRLNQVMDFTLEQFFTKSIQKGKKISQEGLSLKKLEGSIQLTDNIQIKLLADPLTVDIKLDELTQMTQMITELQGFINRVKFPDAKSVLDSLPENIVGHKKGKTDEYLYELQKYAGELTSKLEAKSIECDQLRKKLLEVAGGTGIAGILNIDSEDILCVSQKGRIDTSEVSIVLTKEVIYVMTKEGRVLNRNLSKDMASLEEKGAQELCIKLNNGKSIRGSMENRGEMVSAIKGLFV